MVLPTPVPASASINRGASACSRGAKAKAVSAANSDWAGRASSSPARLTGRALGLRQAYGAGKAGGGGGGELGGPDEGVELQRVVEFGRPGGWGEVQSPRRQAGVGDQGAVMEGAPGLGSVQEARAIIVR